MRTHAIYLPTISNTFSFKNRTISGKGGTVLLRKGGPGSASSYDSVSDYLATTGKTSLTSGSGMSASLNRKLESLSLGMKPKKPKINNIRFNL
jgi:hypothetical protein